MAARHQVATWDFAGRPLPASPAPSARIAQAGAARVCLDGLRLPADHDGYTVVDIETTRAGSPRNRILVHLARVPGTGEPRVIGVRRL